MNSERICIPRAWGTPRSPVRWGCAGNGRGAGVRRPVDTWIGTLPRGGVGVHGGCGGRACAGHGQTPGAGTGVVTLLVAPGIAPARSGGVACRPGVRPWVVLGCGASRSGRGAFRHEGGGGSVGDGGGAQCWALLLQGLWWQGLEVVEDIRGGLVCAAGVALGLGLAAGLAAGWDRGVAAGLCGCLAMGYGGGLAFGCGVEAGPGSGWAAGASFAGVRCCAALRVRVVGLRGPWRWLGRRWRGWVWGLAWMAWPAFRGLVCWMR